MPFARPTLGAQIAALIADIEAHLPGADAGLRRSNLNVLARVQSGATHGLYGFIDWSKDQLLVDTAEAEWLDRHGGIWGIGRIAATFAAGTLDVTGTNAAVIAAGTVFQRADGRQYASTGSATIIAGAATVAVSAIEAGVGGNAAAASLVNLVSPIAGVNSGGLVAVAGLTGGADQETDTALRVRILGRIQAPPHGGADFDYISWAMDQAGITRAWVYPKELGLGTVSVRFMMDDSYLDGIPLAGDVAALQVVIDAGRPVTADVTVVAPTGVPLDLNIGGLNPATQAVKDAIAVEIADLIRREATPGSTLLISHIREAISIAAGEVDNALVSPIADVLHATGQIAVPGVITWS